MNKYNLLDKSYNQSKNNGIVFLKQKLNYKEKNLFLKESYKNINIFNKNNLNKK